MNILDVINWKEYCEDFEVEPQTKERFMEYFELNGKVCLVNQFYEDDFGFYCGPALDYNAVSDSIYLGNYLNKICSELEINCDLYAAENYHIFMTHDPEEANLWFEKLKERISIDFELDVDRD